MIIIGAGIAGLSSAAQLASQGAKVIVFAPNGLGDGASGARTGILCPALGIRREKPLGLFGYQCLKIYPEWLKELGLTISIEPRVSVRLCTSFPRKKSFNQSETHIEQYWLPAKELWARYHYLKKREECIAGAIVSSSIATLSTSKLLAELKNAILDKGGLIIKDAVSGITENFSGIKVRGLLGDEYGADYAVIAAGANTEELILQGTELTTASLPVTTLHPGGMIGVTTPELFDEIIHCDKQTLVCRDGMLWITGGTLSHTNYASFLLARLNGIIDGSFKAVEQWSGTRVRVQGGLPVVQQINHSSRIMVNFAHGGNGFLFAPIASKMVSDFIYQRV